MNIGDYLICHTIPNISGVGGFYTKNKKYKIGDITDDIFYLYDDLQYYRIFTFKEGYNNYYKRWFKTIKEERLEKLYKLDLC